MIKNLLSNQYVFALITKMILVLMGVFNTVFINRYLGPALKGEYAVILNIINIVVLLLNLGIYQSYPFFKRRGTQEVKQKYFNIVFFQFFLYFGIALVLSAYFREFRFTVIFTLTPLMILSQQLGFIAMIENINLRNMLRIGNSAFYTVALLGIFLFAPRDYLYVIGILYVKDILIIARIIQKFGFHFRRKDIDFNLMKQAVTFGVYPMLTALMITMNYRADILILRLFVSFEQIGFYTVGVGLANQVWIIPDAFKDVLFSKTASKDSVDDIALGIKINLYISLLIIMLVAILGKPVIQLLYGGEFLPAYPVTVIIFAGILPMIFFKLINTLFVAKGKQKLSFMILLLAVSLNVAGNFYLIPSYGILGAAYASVLSYALCGGLFVFFFIRNYELGFFDLIVLRKKEVNRLKSAVLRKKVNRTDGKTD